MSDNEQSACAPDAAPDMSGLLRPDKREHPQKELFPDTIDPEWADHWHDMPAFVMKDQTAECQIVTSFMTLDDMNEFERRLGVKVQWRTKSVWFPEQRVDEPKSWRWDGGVGCNARYPLYIMSKGRAKSQSTANMMRAGGIDYHVVVEPVDESAYRCTEHGGKLLVLPFSDLGQGSIPARNWILDHARDSGSGKHWVVDDNICAMYRLHHNRRVQGDASPMISAMEDFSDRFTNVAFSGPNYDKFALDRKGNLSPYRLNTRVYSMILFNHDALDLRWRGKYNEDTDICLRALKAGMCTILFDAFLQNKATTQSFKGGNTDTVYAGDDKRRAFAESLRDQHPDVCKVVWKYNRWHHHVDYRRFKSNALKLKPGHTLTRGTNEYGMVLRRVADPKPENAPAEKPDPNQALDNWAMQIGDWG